MVRHHRTDSESNMIHDATRNIFYNSLSTANNCSIIHIVSNDPALRVIMFYWVSLFLQDHDLYRISSSRNPSFHKIFSAISLYSKHCLAGIRMIQVFCAFRSRFKVKLCYLRE